MLPFFVHRHNSIAAISSSLSFQRHLRQQVLHHQGCHAVLYQDGGLGEVARYVLSSCRAIYQIRVMF